MRPRNFFLPLTVAFLTSITATSHAQINPNVCYVFKNGLYTGSQISKDQFFSAVANEATISCAYGSVVGTNEGRFYAKNAETGQVKRLGGENVSEYEAQTLASQNNVQYYNCAKIVCGQNAVNTSAGMVEPEDQIAIKAQEAAKQVVTNVFESHLKEYLKLVSYANQIKNGLTGFSTDYIRQQAISTAAYKVGYSEGLKECSNSCLAEGESQGKTSALYQASSAVDSILNAAFQKSQKPVFQPMTVPPQQSQLNSLTPNPRYDESMDHIWEEGNATYAEKIRSISSYGYPSCGNFDRFMNTANCNLDSLTSLLSMSQSLLDYNGEVNLDTVFSAFESQSISVDSALYIYFRTISSSSEYQNTFGNRETFKKYFKDAADSAIRSQWPNEINKYANYYPVSNHVTEILQKVLDSLGRKIGFNNGYAEKFLAPAQSGYGKVFDQAFKENYAQRISFYTNNAVFTDVKLAVSNTQSSPTFAAYDDVLLTLKGVSNKGLVDGSIRCEIEANAPKILAVGNKTFKIPAFTKTDKDIALGPLGKIRGEKTSPNDSLSFNVRCGNNSYPMTISVSWVETIKRLGQETRPDAAKILVSYIRFQFNAAYAVKFKSYKMRDTGFDTLAQQFVNVYRNSSTVERARMDLMKDALIKGSFGEEPKKKIFNANTGYKMYQVMKTYFSQIGWTEAPKN